MIEKVNYIAAEKMPDNLMAYSWAGSLLNKFFDAYPKVLRIYYGIVGLIGLGVSALLFLVFNLPWTVAIPIFSWPIIFGPPVMIRFFLIDVRIIEPNDSAIGENRMKLNYGQWWRKFGTLFPASARSYENGKRILWVVKDGDKYRPFKPFTFDKDYLVLSKTNYSSADIAGIEAYANSYKTWSLRKGRSMQQIAQYGVLLLGLGGELLVIWLLANRVAESSV